MNNNDQGMGLSVAVYALAMLGGLALFVLPVLWASGATVYENPAVKTVRLPGGPAYAHQAQFPLAVLKQQQIVDQTALNELNAKSAQKAPAPHRVARAAHRSYAQASEDDGQRPARRSFFPWF
jgi:hypothetical protein